MKSAKILPLVATASLAIFLSGCFEEKTVSYTHLTLPTNREV